jgi:hypothetical protein
MKLCLATATATHIQKEKKRRRVGAFWMGSADVHGRSCFFFRLSFPPSFCFIAFFGRFSARGAQKHHGSISKTKNKQKTWRS